QGDVRLQPHPGRTGRAGREPGGGDDRGDEVPEQNRGADRVGGDVDGVVDRADRERTTGSDRGREEQQTRGRGGRSTQRADRPTGEPIAPRSHICSLALLSVHVSSYQSRALLSTVRGLLWTHGVPARAAIRRVGGCVGTPCSPICRRSGRPSSAAPTTRRSA